MSIYQELFRAAQPCDPQRATETDQQFLIRLVGEISILNDDTWATLSLDAQNWFNAAAILANSTKPILPCPGFKSAETQEQKTVAVKPQYTEAVPAATKAERKQRNRVPGIVDAIRIAAIQHEGWTAGQLYELLRKDWPTVNQNTIAVNIGDIYRVIHLARELGYWKDTPTKKEEKQ